MKLKAVLNGIEGLKAKGDLEIDIKGIGESVVETALKTGLKKLGVKTSTFNSVKSVIDAVKEGDLKNEKMGLPGLRLCS